MAEVRFPTSRTSPTNKTANPTKFISSSRSSRHKSALSPTGCAPTWTVVAPWPAIPPSSPSSTRSCPCASSWWTTSRRRSTGRSTTSASRRSWFAWKRPGKRSTRCGRSIARQSASRRRNAIGWCRCRWWPNWMRCGEWNYEVDFLMWASFSATNLARLFSSARAIALIDRLIGSIDWLAFLSTEWRHLFVTFSFYRLKKQEYLEYQRQIAFQQMQAQEQELQRRKQMTTYQPYAYVPGALVGPPGRPQMMMGPAAYQSPSGQVQALLVVFEYVVQSLYLIVFSSIYRSIFLHLLLTFFCSSIFH